MSKSTTTINANINKTEKLLNIFCAAHHIQEKIMWVESDRKHPYGYYKKTYRSIFEEIEELHKDIENSIEAKVFQFGLEWENDLFDIVDCLVEKEFGDRSQESKYKYFAKYVQKYIDEYTGKYLKNNQ